MPEVTDTFEEGLTEIPLVQEGRALGASGEKGRPNSIPFHRGSLTRSCCTKELNLCRSPVDSMVHLTQLLADVIHLSELGTLSRHSPAQVTHQLSALMTSLSANNVTVISCGEILVDLSRPLPR